MNPGLTNEEAARRLAAEGPNEIPHSGRRQLLHIVRDVLREPMFALLLVAGLLYLLLGDTLEAILLLVFASLSVAIAVVQETRSERVLEALQDLTSPRALVIRDGERRRIAGREVVRGDLLVLSEGDRIPADAVVLETSELQTDESLLTGESLPVRKTAARPGTPIAVGQPGGDDLPHVFSGTLVVRGQALAEVRAIGTQSALGRLGSTLTAIDASPPRLSEQTGRLVRIAAGFGLACCILVVLLYGLLRGAWLDALLAGVALGMSMLPEEFPLVLTVFMVMGAWRLSRARVLTRRAAAIETLGEATVLCTDKTGTLTENRMSVVALHAGDATLRFASGAQALPQAFRRLAMIGKLASLPNAYDPMDRAFHAFAADRTDDTSDWSVARVYGVEPDLLAVTQVWQRAAETPMLVACKGAPESVATLCHLDPASGSALIAEADTMANDGMRVLAVAEAVATGDLPPTPRGFSFKLLGLVGLADPLRTSVPAAIQECRQAGIRVAMITGDYPVTAQAIACQAGLDDATAVDGSSIERMTDPELQQVAQQTGIFARILPAQKLRIVRALQSRGDVVAMTGDGVNDAPSLKAADIGIAMGGRGTDVAREAASLVLLDDDFTSIVHTIRLGRRIYDNLRKAMAYIIAVHVPIAGLTLLPLLAGMPLIFGPIHIAFLEMVIDPVCSMVFEAEPAEPDTMRRAPRATGSNLFSAPLLCWSLLQGLIALLALGLLYSLALWTRLPEEDARALTFVSLVLVDLGLVLVNRSFSSVRTPDRASHNRALWAVTTATSAILVLVLLSPFGRTLFHFGPLHGDDLIVVAAVVLSVVGALQFLKRFWHTQLVA
ncbi:MAG TPA: cation-translocating P-type ATPase [Acetobacteraceae bacterium]|nr:cation-translocating P-type ATPase [Acetobacteraceae bacterium]